MKRILASLIVVILSASFSAAQNVSITDYKVPESQAKSLKVNASYNYAATGDSTLTDDGLARVIYKQFYSSLPFAWYIDLDGSLSKLDEESSHSVNMSTRVNKYLSLIPSGKSDESDFFVFGGLEASHAEDYEQVQSRISAGAGYGRFVSATAFAKAIRIDNFLLDQEVISGHLDKKILIELGNVIEREEEFEDRFGAVYEPYWYEAMEEVIRKSGKLNNDSLGAVGILRIKEVLFVETIHDRYYGWDVRTGVAYDLTTADKSEGDPSMEAGFSFSYPLNLGTQINHRTQYNSYFEDFGESYTVSSSTEYIYELSNRIDFLGGYQFQSSKLGVDQDAIDSHAILASFIFYVENSINLVLNGQLGKSGDQDWNKSIQLSLGYRIW